MEDIGVRCGGIQARHLLYENEHMLHVFHSRAYRPLPPIVPAVVTTLVGFQEVFIHDLLSLRRKHQLRNPQLEQLDNDPVVGGGSAPEKHLAVVLQPYFELELHRGEEFVGQPLEERIAFERDYRFDSLLWVSLRKKRACSDFVVGCGAPCHSRVVVVEIPQLIFCHTSRVFVGELQ